MTYGPRVEFTVARERARREAIVKRAARATVGVSSTVLCPDAATARAIERALSRGGGAWVSVWDWDLLLDALESSSGLAKKIAPHEATRLAWVEAALATMDDTALARAMSVDPSAVSRALLRAADAVRACGYDETSVTVVDEACGGLDPRLEPLVRKHLSLVDAGVRAIEAGFAASATLDRIGRIRRLNAFSELRVPRGLKELVVDGVDLVSPIERGLLEALVARGVRVDVAPWVHGWGRPSPRPTDADHLPESGLEALGRFPSGDQCPNDDDSIVECFARDPDEAADAVAAWVSTLAPEARSSVAIAVSGAAGDGPRVLRALERYGVEGSYRGALSVPSVPLWNVLRASLRLLWRGPSVLDLAAITSAPGSGTWGGDRDRIVARLRSSRPKLWSDVRAAVIDCTDPAQHAYVLRDGAGPGERVFDPDRAAALESQRRSVLALIAVLEGESPFSALDPPARLARVRAVTEHCVDRFANAQRIQASVRDGRAASLWVAAASAIRAATTAVLDALEREPSVLSTLDPTPLLLRIERMLPSISDAVRERRGDVVRVVNDGDRLDDRPEVLVVLGFVARLFPRPSSPIAWLGSTERAALAKVRHPSTLGELPEEGLVSQLASRDTHRLFASPTRRLVLVRTDRSADGSTTAVSSTRADVLDAYVSSVSEQRERRALEHVRVALDSSATAAAAKRALVGRVGSAVNCLDESVVEELERHLERAPEDHALFAARLAPSRDFAIASALRESLATSTYSPADLELATKCRFAFATRAVLGVRWLPLAQGPRFGPRGLLRDAHAALRVLDAYEGDVDRAIDAAMTHEAKGDALEAAGARRVLRGFVRRFAAQRAKWKATEIPVAKAEEGASDAVSIELGCEHPAAPKAVSVRAEIDRVERVIDGEHERVVLVDVRMGRLDSDEARSTLGLGAASAVLPAVAEARIGRAVDAVAAVSLNRGDMRVVGRDGSPAAGDGERSLTTAAREAKRRFAVVFDAIAAGDEPVAPHDRERRAALVAAGVRSCEGCPSRLLCRFDLPGETL
ncbi:MAG: PD-(D/E)XK nuclease family protein [Myxococcales bacterium]|nr:PD-(D/E)XK nuclease family protein [Myxococcales bacterium]